ncbi:hypothetical protein GCM10027614_65830 [Micromonospora vulcania]
MARDSPVAHEVTEAGLGMRAMPFAQWISSAYRLAHGRWNGPPLLKFLPTGAAHSVWWFRDAQDRFVHWYVNLEEPGVRWDDGPVAGVDVVDQDLDVVVRPDRSWQWKDEDEFVERLAFPDDYWVTDEKAVRAEGERVIALAEAGSSRSTAPGATSRRRRSGAYPTNFRRDGTARRCAECVPGHRSG